jgi:hypothetical protein
LRAIREDVEEQVAIEESVLADHELLLHADDFINRDLSDDCSSDDRSDNPNGMCPNRGFRRAGHSEISAAARSGTGLPNLLSESAQGSGEVETEAEAEARAQASLGRLEAQLHGQTALAKSIDAVELVKLMHQLFEGKVSVGERLCCWACRAAVD